MHHVRHVIIGLLFLSAMTTDLTRSDINIAIVTMVTPLPPSRPSSIMCPPVVHEEQLFPSPSNQSSLARKSLPDFSHRQYDWDQETQGLILGSFFWAYMLMHIPGGMISQKWGGKSVVCVSIIGSSVISLITPFITDFHVCVLILSRTVMGLMQGGFYPAAFGMLCDWVPLKERALAFAIMDAGSYIGSVVNFYAAGFLTIAFGWTMLFFVPGIISAIVGLCVMWLCNNAPHDSPLSSPDDEIAVAFPLPQPKTPWTDIMTNKAVLAAAAFKFSLGWNFCVFYMEMPKYLNEVIHEDIRSNGEINSVVNLLNGVTLMLTGMISEKLISNGWLSRTTCRKVFAVFSGLGYGVCMLVIPVVGCHEVYLKIMLFVCASLAGFAGGSDLPLASEMSQNFPAVIYAICNLISMGAGAFVPLYTGLILTHFQDQWLGWSIVFHTSGALSCIAFVFFLFFASASRQDFDYTSEERHTIDKERNKA